MTSSRRRPQGPAEVVDDAAREVGRRVVRRSVAWWRTRTADGRTRADAVLALVQALAHAGQAVEGAPEPYHTPCRPPREDVLVDMLAVVAYDLVLALRAAPGDGTGAAAETGAAAGAVAGCLRTAFEVDPRRPLPGHLVDAALATGVPRDLLAGLPRDDA